MNTTFTLLACGMTMAVARAAEPADPFADVTPAPSLEIRRAPSAWRDNWLFRLETLAVAATRAEPPAGGDVYTRLSVGFETQTRWASATRTMASANY